MRQAPQLVLGLALLDTSARPDDAAGKQGRQALIAKAEEDFAAVLAGLLEGIRSMANSLGPAAFMRQQQAMLGRIDSRPGLAQIR